MESGGGTLARYILVFAFAIAVSGIGKPADAGTLEAGWAYLPSRYEGVKAKTFMPLVALSAPLGSETYAAVTAAYVRYGTSGRTRFVPISAALRAVYGLPEGGPGAIYVEAGPALVLARWRLSQSTTESHVLLGALGRGGVWIPLGGPVALDLGAGYIVTQDKMAEFALDASREHLEGIASALFQIRLVVGDKELWVRKGT
jgi:hypothetical protein